MVISLELTRHLEYAKIEFHVTFKSKTSLAHCREDVVLEVQKCVVNLCRQAYSIIANFDSLKSEGSVGLTRVTVSFTYICENVNMDNGVIDQK